jgi:cytochrome b involved in lipid metabolism
LVVQNKVFDATAFLEFHPAGRKTILRHAGTDCLEHYEFHGSRARKLWAKCEIGRVAGAPEPSSCALM